MISSQMSGLPLKLVMLHAIKPKDLACWARVCKNWRCELRKDEYWYKFKIAVCKSLPCLSNMFTDRKPIWHVFVHRLWPLARNLHRSAMQIGQVNAHILMGIFNAYLKKQTLHLEVYADVGTVANVYGAIKVKQEQDTWSVLFKNERIVQNNASIEPWLKDNLLKLKRVAGKQQSNKTCRVICSVSKNQKFIQHVSVQQFFRPYLACVFAGNV